jgi:hypothetical protein
MTVVDISKINFDNFKFAPNNSKSNRVFMKLYYNKKPFIFKIPRVKIPFNSQKNKFNQIEVCVNIPKELKPHFKELDSIIQDLLKEEKPHHNCDFQPSLNENNPNFEPLFKFKIFNTDGKFPSLFDSDKQLINIDSENDFLSHLKKRNQGIFAIECSGLWIREGRCGLSFKLVQGRVFDNDNLPQEEDYAFDDSDSSSVDEYLFDD